MHDNYKFNNLTSQNNNIFTILNLTAVMQRERKRERESDENNFLLIFSK